MTPNPRPARLTGVVAGAVAAALWMLANGLNVAVTFNSTLPTALANLVFPAAVRSVTWVSDPPWNVVTPIVSALAVGTVVALSSRAIRDAGTGHGPSRLIRFLAAWLLALLSAGLVGFALALGQTFHDWPPSRLWTAFDGFPDVIEAAVLWGLVWGWIPALLISRVPSDTLQPRPSTPNGVVLRRRVRGAAAAAIVLAVVVVSSSLTGYTVPTDPSEPLPTVQPTGPAVPLTADGSPAVDPQWCSDDQLTVEAGATDGAAGHRTLGLIATNRAGVDCVLDGYPDIAFADADDFLLTMHVVHGGSFSTDDAGPTPITLSGGQSVIARLGWDAQPRDPDHTVAYIHIAPYPGAERVPLPVSVDLIQDADVAVTAWASYTPVPAD
ncbi:DUF4232 domain-containing protein [Subtercola sp. YIM 133946]|uniref:DUF4232 domain-containing protein n=1 Tax=Subtercola sp. YIM 133946 TaxID=3118909 RepID=UPI002F9315E2